MDVEFTILMSCYEILISITAAFDKRHRTIIAIIDL